MPAPEIRLHARPSRGQLMQIRLRLYLRKPTLMMFTLGGLVGTPLLRLSWSALSQRPWPSEFDHLLFVAPVVGLVPAAIWVFGGLNHPQTLAYLREGAHYALSEESLSVRAHLGEACLKWDACTEATEFPDSFVLRVGNEQHFLPKSGFAAGDVGRFREILRERVGKRARLER